MVRLNEIKGCMASNNHTQKYLADTLKISCDSLNKKLNGKRDFTLKEISSIAKIYNKKTSFFLN